MKTLLIHHNNTAFLSEPFFKKQYLFEASSTKDVDSYITEEFIEDNLITDLNTAELVFIKVSLSDNYLEYLGIRLAYHLRLDNRVTNKKFTIVFLGEESLSFLCKTYENYPILLAEGVYKIRDSKEEIKSFLEQDAYKRFIEEGSFTIFLDKIWLRPPANFESNHSIANEWGICRLFDSLKDDNNEHYDKLKADVNNLTFKNSLYFKYTEAKIDFREGFKSKKQQQINNLGFEDLKVALIDDEYGKGWYSLYQLILDKSKAVSFPFFDFSREIGKEGLIERVKDWITNEAISKNRCNTFLLDLRLHEDDFDKTTLDEELTGITIYKFIKSLNPGYQVVFITASNKIWNLDFLEDYDVNNYIVKESPDYRFGRENTLRFLQQFNRALGRCKERVFLVEAYDLKVKIQKKRTSAKIISDIEFLDSAFKANGLFDKIYRCLERDIDNQSDLHQALLFCFHFLEKYCRCEQVAQNSGASIEVYDYSKVSFDVVKSTGNRLRKIRENFDFQIAEVDPDKKPYKSIVRLSTPEVDTNLGTSRAVEYSSVLYFRENCNQIEVDRVLQLLFIRNNLSAHHTGKIRPGHKLKSDDIMFMLKLFDKIQL